MKSRSSPRRVAPGWTQSKPDGGSLLFLRPGLLEDDFSGERRPRHFSHLRLLFFRQDSQDTRARLLPELRELFADAFGALGIHELHQFLAGLRLQNLELL